MITGIEQLLSIVLVICLKTSIEQLITDIEQLFSIVLFIYMITGIEQLLSINIFPVSQKLSKKKKLLLV